MKTTNLPLELKYSIVLSRRNNRKQRNLRTNLEKSIL